MASQADRPKEIRLTKLEAQITYDVLSMVLNDPDWQDIASATGQEWAALGRAHAKIGSIARQGD